LAFFPEFVDVGRGSRGGFAPWILKISAKKVVFMVSRGKKQI